MGETVDGVENIALMSGAEALDFLQCIDQDGSSAHLARLRELNNNASIKTCSEIKKSCRDAVTRMFCPHTCECDTTLTGLYIRDGCSGSCDDALLDEIFGVETRLYAIGLESASCISNVTGWMGNFLSELQESLVRAEDLTWNGSAYVWSTAFVDDFNARSQGHFSLNATGVDVTQWVDTSVGDGVCDAILVIDNLFGTTLCESTTSFAASRGSLQGLCPKACGLCDAVTGGTSTLVDSTVLYYRELDGFNSGLFKIKLVEKIEPTPALSCGTRTYGDTTYRLSTYGGDSPDMIYTFTSDIAQTVTFSTCNSSGFNTAIRIYDTLWNEKAWNVYVGGCFGWGAFVVYTSRLTWDVTENETINVLIEGASAWETGHFWVEVIC